VVGDGWEAIPGWNEAERKYEPLDCERWIRENRIRETGRENGEQDFPPSEAAQPDDVYEKILDWVNQRGRTYHAEVSEYLRQQRYNLEQEGQDGMAPIQHEVVGLRDEGMVKLTVQVANDRGFLAQKERAARNAWAALEGFRKEARLEKREAEFEGRYTWYWWLIGIVVIEAVANAMMLSGVNEYGLLGALGVMIAIGVVNAGILASMIGGGWRLKNSTRVLVAAGGWLIVVSGTGGMVAWNLLVGHFRDSMLSVVTRTVAETDSLEDLLADDTVERFLTSPMGLEGMYSWVLAAVGAGFCIFAANKWLSRDDIYPGYGSMYRAWTDRAEEYTHEIERREKGLEEIYTRYVGRIRDERDKVGNKKGNHQLITDTANDIVRQFRVQISQYQNNLDFILAAYRSENEKARKTPSPKFFSEKLLVDQDMLEAPKWQGVSASNYDKDWEGFLQAEDAIRQTYRDAQAGYSTLADLMEGESAREKLGQ